MDAWLRQDPHHRLLIRLPDSLLVLSPLHFLRRFAEICHTLDRIVDRNRGASCIHQRNRTVRSYPHNDKGPGISVPSQRGSLPITEFLSFFQIVRIIPAVGTLLTLINLTGLDCQSDWQNDGHRGHWGTPTCHEGVLAFYYDSTTGSRKARGESRWINRNWITAMKLKKKELLS
jgi:hypothetical protein